MGKNKRRDSDHTALNLPPVAADQTGEGLPYAPINFPDQGDVWGWKTGKRLQSNGCFQDRYLFSPVRFKPGSKRKHRHTFASKLSVERYIKSTFPDADVDKFFASFTWRIPAAEAPNNGDNVMPISAVPLHAVPLQQIPQVVEPDYVEPDYDDNSKIGVVWCKARNKMCDSLKFNVMEKYLPAMPCDVCCSESEFCRDCSCILCSKTVSFDHGGYSYIKCLVNGGDGICGHVAHLECALRSQLAGTVAKSIGLDVEYHCRRCDGRTNLLSHVETLYQSCKSVDLDDEIKKKILDLGACILRGSKIPVAKELLNCVELAISKLKCVANNEDIKNGGDNLMAHSEGLPDHGTDPMEVTMNGSPFNQAYHSQILNIEAEVGDILVALRKSQELEYKVAEERLHEQKRYIQNLYERLQSEVTELESPNLTHSEPLFRAIGERKEQIKRELEKFKEMKLVASGFGRISRDILKEHFAYK
ncbi:OBERON-like protein [Trifolium pratense]|uniref:OBERON-like protein n=1 Tax=Trifolium pratense TaxID=57577 RepID=UPI001E692A78|nr:OBERON-like protein [Trifolium pratense]